MHLVPAFFVFTLVRSDIILAWHVLALASMLVRTTASCRTQGHFAFAACFRKFAAICFKFERFSPELFGGESFPFETILPRH